MIEIKAGEIAEIRDIPLLSKFTITELNKEGYEIDNINNDGAFIYGRSDSTGIVKNPTNCVIYTNKVLKGKIEITKVDTDDTSKKLKDAEFKLEKINTDTKKLDEDFTLKSATTKSDGKAVFDDLLYGTYRITEVKSPEGYNLLNNPIEVTLDKNNNGIVKITVQNSREVTLPYTGAGGIKIFIEWSVIFIAAAGTVYIIVRHKNKIEVRK